MLFSWLCHSIWLLFIYNMLKLPVFLSHFADGLHDWRHFYWLLLLEFQEITYQRFLWHSLSRNSKEAPLGYL